MSASDRNRRCQLEVNAATRRQLVQRARNSRTRTAVFTWQRPTDWRPGEVYNPEGVLESYFTDSTAWEFIAARLEADEAVEVVQLRKPKGAQGYVMKIDLGPGVPELYVKLQMGPKKVIGRSFHYSEHARR